MAFADHQYFIWFILWVTAALTAFYSFRLIMLVFFGEEKYKEAGIHPHEAYKFMLYAMSPLALLAMISGFFEHSFLHMVSNILPGHHPHLDDFTVFALIGVTTFAAVSGILVAVKKYSTGGFSKELENRFCYKLFKNQYYIPEIYNAVFIRTYTVLSTIAWKIDIYIVDAIVDLLGKMMLVSGKANSKTMHSGNLSKMLRLMVIGLLMMFVLAILFSLFGKGVI
jgi:NADH-quinone oxidoreductase subunit L